MGSFSLVELGLEVSDLFVSLRKLIVCLRNLLRGFDLNFLKLSCQLMHSSINFASCIVAASQNAIQLIFSLLNLGLVGLDFVLERPTLVTELFLLSFHVLHDIFFR